MKEEVAVENLREMKEILDKNRINYWLDAGTLLGAVRNGKIIGWDHDIDLATWYENVDRIVSIFPELKKRGFEANVTKEKLTIGIVRMGHTIQFNIYPTKISMH